MWDEEVRVLGTIKSEVALGNICRMHVMGRVSPRSSAHWVCLYLFPCLTLCGCCKTIKRNNISKGPRTETGISLVSDKRYIIIFTSLQWLAVLRWSENLSLCMNFVLRRARGYTNGYLPRGNRRVSIQLCGATAARMRGGTLPCSRIGVGGRHADGTGDLVWGIQGD